MQDAIRAQEGPQEDFLSTSADIAIMGGSAGGGKTHGMLMDPLRHIDSCPEAGAVYFRKTSTQIRNQGGLFDEAKAMYLPLGASDRESPSIHMKFKNKTNPEKEGFKITFSHLQHEKDKYNFQGAQIPIIYFDELTHFTRTQFFYLVGRNRTTCGIKPYVRATCNPDKTSWLRKFIDWWIDEDGWAIPERSGVIRWLCVFDDKDYWFDSKEEAQEKFPKIPPLSVTFILSRLKDNKILMKEDPSYLAKLMALSKVERMRLLGDENRGGNWDVVPAAGMYFKRHYFEEVDFIPPLIETVRCWDRAATEAEINDPLDPDWTAGVKVGKCQDGTFIILDVERQRYSPGKVDNLILNMARQDGVATKIRIFQDPGGAGKGEAEAMVKKLSGFIVEVDKVTKDKETLAKPLSSAAENGMIKILSSCRNKEFYYSELENFPEDSHDDMVDGSSGAYNSLNSGNVGQFTDEFNADNMNENTNIDLW